MQVFSLVLYVMQAKKKLLMRFGKMQMRSAGRSKETTGKGVWGGGRNTVEKLLSKFFER